MHPLQEQQTAWVRLQVLARNKEQPTLPSPGSSTNYYQLAKSRYFIFSAEYLGAAASWGDQFAALYDEADWFFVLLLYCRSIEVCGLWFIRADPKFVKARNVRAHPEVGLTQFVPFRSL